MGITINQKREISLAFGVNPSHYFNKDNLIDSQLYKFGNVGHLSFKFAERGETSPGIGFYVRDKKRSLYAQQFTQIKLPAGFVVDNGQIHTGRDDGNGWVSFCRTGFETQEQVYADIVNPGNGVKEWKSLLTTLLEGIGKIVKCKAETFSEEKGWPQNLTERGQTSTPFHDAVPTIGEGRSNGGAQNGHDQDAKNALLKARNLLVFGAPGTGKSHLLEVERKMEKDGVWLFPDANYERVTFYATYSYAQFVGSYKPVMKGEGVSEKIAYEFVPGPFLRTLVKALNRPDENFLLIIEEINRANAAAVFGDVFQLLDRGVDGVSEYSIAASEDVKKYLEKVLTEGGKQALVKLSGSVDKLKISANLYLWATMNSADQGVFPLDTAFKRRWSFEYIGIDDGEPQAPELKIQIKNETYDWKTLRKFLNRLLVLNGVNEDKLMGPFFLKDATEFESKVLMYLWEDASRMCRRAVFGEIKTYSDLCKSWADKGIVVFNTKTFDDKILQGFEDDLVNA